MRWYKPKIKTMGNMSYCRFQNTSKDFSDCVDNIEDSDLSKDEVRARRELIEQAYSLLESLGATIDQEVDELIEQLEDRAGNEVEGRAIHVDKIVL